MTETEIKSLQAKPADYMVGCGAGLWLRVRTSGRKTFIIRRKQGGRTKIITLGEWPTLSLREATRKTATTATPADATMADLVEGYRKAVIAGHRRPKQFDAYERRILAAIGRRRVSEVTTQALAGLVADAKDTPRAADTLRAHLKAMFALAMEMGWRPDNPAVVIGARVTGYKYDPRTRILTHDEIRQLWTWQGRNAALLRFLLLTGLRISEGQTGRLDGDFWRLDSTKNGKPHWVFLTDTAKAQLATPFDMSPTATQAWVRRKQELRADAWTPHDLRRTFATLAMDAGVQPHVIEKCLNHAMEGMLRVYAHAELADERIEAAKIVERVVLEIVNSPTTGKSGAAGGTSG